MQYLTVYEFAKEVQRYPNQIYDLINKGNQFRKLKTTRLAGKIHIPKSEIYDFPFNAVDKLRIDFAERLTIVEKEIAELRNLSTIKG